MGLSAQGNTFSKSEVVYAVGPQPCAIVAADLNDDGLPEIVTADRGALRNPREDRPANDTVSLLVAEGGLRYRREALQTGFGPYAIAIANMDARKAPDIVAASFHAAKGKNLAVFRNLSGTFSPEYFPVSGDLLRYERMRESDGQPVFTTPGITSLVVGHIDRDEYRDVVCTGWSSDALIVFPGHAERFLSEPRFINAPGGPRDVAAADLDGDGHVDAVTTMYCSQEVVIWRGDGTGAFEEMERMRTRNPLPHKVELADVDLDGRLDLVVSHCHAADAVVVFYGEGDFRFGHSQEIPVADAENPAVSRHIVEEDIRDIAVCDMNGDKRPDIAAACSASGDVVLLLSQKADSRGLPRFRKERYSFQNAQPRAVCAGDFNEDGLIDLAVALWREDGGAVSLLLGR